MTLQLTSKQVDLLHWALLNLEPVLGEESDLGMLKECVHLREVFWRDVKARREKELADA